MAQRSEPVPVSSSGSRERVIPCLASGRYTSWANTPHDFLEGRMRVDGLLPESTQALEIAVLSNDEAVNVFLPTRTFDRKVWTCFLCCSTFSTPFDLDFHVPRAHPVEHRLWLEYEFEGTTCRWLRHCISCG